MTPANSQEGNGASSPVGEANPFMVKMEVEPAHRAQADRLVSVFARSFDEADHAFDFEKAMAAAQAHPGIAVVGTTNRSLKEERTTVSAAAKTVERVLGETLSEVGAPGDIQLTDTVIKAFDHLGEQQANPWFRLLESTGRSTTYQYNLFFVLQGPETGAVMIGAPVSLEVTVDVDKKTLFGRLQHRKVSYGIQVKGLTLVEPLTAP